MPGWQNDIGYSDNLDLSGATTPADANGLQTNGQLWIGTTALNAGGTHINVGTLTSPDASVTIGYSSPNITLQAGTAMGTVKTLTPDEDFDGSAATPISGTAGNINVSGSTLAAAVVTETYNSTGLATGNLEVEHRAWTTEFVVDSSTTVGARGTFSTIASAITAASSGDTIFIRAGTYTENLTLKAGVNIVGYGGDELTPSVTIIGTCSFAVAGTVGISNIRLQTNSAAVLSITGSAASIVNLEDCYLNCTNNTGISFTTASTSAIVTLKNCYGDLGTTGIGLYTMSSTGNLYLQYCYFTNNGSSTTASTNSAGEAQHWWSRIESPVSTSSNGEITMRHSRIRCGQLNATALTHAATGGSSGSSSVSQCIFNSGTASCVSIGAGSTLLIMQTDIGSTNTNAITGSGTLDYAGIGFSDSSSLINTTTQVAMVSSNDAGTVQLPAGNLTIKASDRFIGVETSATRTITLPASKSVGQIHTIADITGSAASNNITVSGNGSNILGSTSAASFTMNVNGQSIDVRWTGSVWKIT